MNGEKAPDQIKEDQEKTEKQAVKTAEEEVCLKEESFELFCQVKDELCASFFLKFFPLKSGKAYKSNAPVYHSPPTVNIRLCMLY